MATHFHYCDHCGFQYRCDAVLERDDVPSQLCAFKATRLCDECAAAEPMMPYSDHYEQLRAEDDKHLRMASAHRRKGRW